MATIKTKWFNESDFYVNLRDFVKPGFTIVNAGDMPTTVNSKGVWLKLPNESYDRLYKVPIGVEDDTGKYSVVYASIGVYDDLTLVKAISGGKEYIAPIYDAATIRAGSTNDILHGSLSADKLYAGAGNDKVIGERGSDLIYGQDGNDALYGGDHHDKLYAGNGDDTLKGGNGDDLLSGAAGADKLHGDADSDWLQGGSGNDALSGGTGNDYLVGDAGRDLLYGGKDADVFVFRKITDSGVASSTRDVVKDYAQADWFDFSLIDANSKISGNQAFTWMGTKAFDGDAGELRYQKTSGNTYIYADIDGDKKADFSLKIEGAFTLDTGHVFL